MANNLVIGLTIKGIIPFRDKVMEAGREAEDALEEAAVVEAERIMERAKQRVPVDLGTLRASGTVLPPRREGGQVVVTIGFGGAAAPYAIAVHEGRSPGAKQPPVEPLKEWARRHGMPEAAAYPIARKIGSQGIPATKFLEGAFLEALPYLERRLAATVRRRLIGGG